MLQLGRYQLFRRIRLEPESFSLMNAMEFANDQYLSWDLTYWANGALFNRLPLIKYLKLREVVAFRGLYGSLKDRNNPQFNKSKWENYRQRYSERFHTDLLESLGNFGSVRNLKLDALSNLIGFPGKYDTSGDQVLELYYQGQQEKIDTYCQSDVLNTYGLYLNYELLKGNLTQEDYCGILMGVKEKLPQESAYYGIFCKAVNGILESLGA